MKNNYIIITGLAYVLILLNLSIGAKAKTYVIDNQKIEDYPDSWAMVVGIDDYQYWPQLQNAVHDAKGVVNLLVNRFNFPAANVFLITDAEASRANIMKTISFIAKKADPEDRVVIFFAGHGTSEIGVDRLRTGYLLPIDAPKDYPSSVGISMAEIRDKNKVIAAKHIFWIMDACFSGTLLESASDILPDMKNRAKWRAVRGLTAGQVDEQVPDGGGIDGHSKFTGFLIDGMRNGYADFDNNRVITSEELSQYVTNQLKLESKQKPKYGKLPTDKRGDILFFLPETVEEEDLVSEIDSLKQHLQDLEQKKIADSLVLIAEMESLQVEKQELAEKKRTDSLKAIEELEKLEKQRIRDSLNALAEIKRIEQERETRIEEFISLALGAIEKKAFDLAIEFCNEVLSIDSTSTEAISILEKVEILIKEEQESRELAQLREHQRRDSIRIAAEQHRIDSLNMIIQEKRSQKLAENINSLLSQADDAFQGGSYKRAIKYCNEVLALDPKNPSAMEIKSQSELLLGNTQELSEAETDKSSLHAPGRIPDIEFVPILGASYLMGAPEIDEWADADEQPMHLVNISDFYISKHEVTAGQYLVFLQECSMDTVRMPVDSDNNVLIYPNPWALAFKDGNWKVNQGKDNYPVVNVTWYGAKEFCKFFGWRLPTEAEWEFCCRAGSVSRFTFGTGDCDKKECTGCQLDEYAWWCGCGNNQTHQVGTKKPNQWGLYDMHGNVYEWCYDWYKPDYYKESLIDNPPGPMQGVYKVLRGGSWMVSARLIRSTVRVSCSPSCRFNYYGFRVTADVLQ